MFEKDAKSLRASCHYLTTFHYKEHSGNYRRMDHRSIKYNLKNYIIIIITAFQIFFFNCLCKIITLIPVYVDSFPIFILELSSLMFTFVMLI